MGYGRKHAELYDAVFVSRGKDWAAEADAVAEVALDRCPGARSLLDVACGTGAHLAAFAGRFAHVAGVEPAEAMREIAESRVPGLVVHPHDMREIAVDREFDVVTCLFFAVTYMPTPEDLATAIAAMARCLAPRGVLIVEPWWFTDRFIDGYVGGHMSKEDGRVVSRITHSVREGDRVRMTIRFVVADRTGIDGFTETEVVSLFTEDDYHRAFQRAGLVGEYLPGWVNGTGLFVAQRPM
ncbi:class I SAM-dependent methyltransferase [Goodfellowiella coeruleoviolacea]|uniref:Methyltransferase domain-containing protein n=1 Tax=Goodfellowiella coeruleoviolacea TaxID=334858 RepID=A0AAE3KGW8_9PSEU|nr:class I SAM-dependent methyltransferase [Goodfellowiella coeruleoviolacea]MCP2167706.1 Methyltransferase domain-containing protein [Goodfellowiella coeruleoviolacea]